MLIIAHHNVKDPEKFWNEARTVTSKMPANFRLHSVFPSADGRKGTCVWEAPNVEDVQKFLDDMTGGMAINYCYEVNGDTAFGIPETTVAAINN